MQSTWIKTVSPTQGLILCCMDHTGRRKCELVKNTGNTVILLMAEIRRLPVEVGSLSHYLKGFIHHRWLFGISSINSI